MHDQLTFLQNVISAAMAITTVKKQQDQVESFFLQQVYARGWHVAFIWKNSLFFLAVKQVGLSLPHFLSLFCNHQAHHLDEWMTNKLQIFLPVTDQIDIYNQLVATPPNTGPPSPEPRLWELPLKTSWFTSGFVLKQRELPLICP